MAVYGMMKESGKAGKHKKLTRLQRKEQWTAYLCLLPAFLGVVFISYLPTLAVFVMSLTDWNGLTKPHFVGLDNYLRIFTGDIYFAASMEATLTYTVLAVAGSIVWAFLVALFLSLGKKGKSILGALFFLPYMLPAIGVYKGWQWIYEPNFGLLNFLFRFLGLEQKRFLNSPSQVIFFLVLIAIWQSGNLIIIFLAGLQNVPDVYREAAMLDGAGGWQRFFYITLPCMKPVILYNILLAVITHIQVINPALALTDGGPDKRTMFLSYVIYMYAFEKNKPGYGAAWALVFFVISGIFTVVLFRIYRRD